MSQLNLAFPDNVYTSSNKPSVATLKADLAAIEAAFNDLESEAIRADGSVVMASDLGMGGNQISNLGAPASASDAARLDSAYPVGTVYINADVATSPATLLGFGTWSQISQGRVLIGQNGSDPDFDTAGETGGAKTATLITDNIPSHSHTGTTASDGAHTHSVTDPGHLHSVGLATNGDQDGSGSNGATYGSGMNTGSQVTGISIVSGGAHTHTFTTDTTGSGTAFSIMNPYLVVYIWKRTA